MVLLIEGMAMCLIMLMTCVIGIAVKGPAGLVTFYEEDVQKRVIELGLNDAAGIRRSAVLSGIAVLLPVVFFIPAMVYGLNGATGFAQGFGQMLVIGWIYGLFDRIFIDWYWVEHTNAWLIPGTEDLKPYIPRSAKIKKWAATLILFPLYFALAAYVMTLFER